MNNKSDAKQDDSHLKMLLKEMLRIRRFEERCAELYMEEKIRGFLHLYIGEEAVAVGVMQALTAEDAVVSTYREHGHALAVGLALAISESEQHIFKKAASYGLPAEAVDGMQVSAVEAAARASCEAIRAEGGPRFLECLTYRFRGHSMFDAQLYRTPDEVEQWQQKGPIVQLRHELEQSGGLDEAYLQQLEQDVRQEVNAAVAFAEQSEFEPESALCWGLYQEPGV